MSSIKIGKYIIKEAPQLDFATAIDVANWLVKTFNISSCCYHKVGNKVVKIVEEKNIFSFTFVSNSVSNNMLQFCTSPDQLLCMFKKISCI